MCQLRSERPILWSYLRHRIITHYIFISILFNGLVILDNFVNDILFLVYCKRCCSTLQGPIGWQNHMDVPEVFNSVGARCWSTILNFIPDLMQMGQEHTHSIPAGARMNVCRWQLAITIPFIRLGIIAIAFYLQGILSLLLIIV